MALSEIPVECPHCAGKMKVKIPGASPGSDAPPAPAAPAPSGGLDLSALGDRLKGLEHKLGDIPEDFCSRFPALCQDVAEMKSRQEQALEEDAHAHFAPSDELFEHWDTCPDCKAKADDLAKRLVARVKASEKAQETPAPAPAEESPEETPAEEEYLPPWKRG